MAIIIGSTSAGPSATVTMADVKLIIQAHGYGTDTAGIQTTAIQFALRNLYGMRRWKFLRTINTTFSATVANDGIVDISTLGRGIMIDTVRVGFGTDYRDMRFVEDNELDRARWEERSTGMPSHWTRAQNTVKVFPRPDGTYPLELSYQAITTLPAADGDPIPWPESHIDVVVYAAIAVLAFRQRDTATRDRVTQLLEASLVTMFRDEEQQDQQTDLEVGTWDGWDLGGVPLP